MNAGELVLVRHAETQWSREGRHTGRTDLPLSAAGRAAAMALAPALAGRQFAQVLTSPARRAIETCELCGLGQAGSAHEELWEWDYGDYEGRTTSEIRSQRPGWQLWRDGCPGGESAADVGRRADRVIALAEAADGPVAIVSHGHMLRVLASRWIALDASLGARLALSTAAISVLGHERELRVIARWNDTAAAAAHARP